MKKVLCACTLGLAVLTGCTPTAEQINKTATAVGYAAGLVANQTNIKEDARNAIVSVLNDVRGCVPAAGQSFAVAWAPVIKEKVDALVKEGKINAATGEIVSSVAIMAAKGVDYLFDVRFPDAKKYEELVAAGVSGAVDGFLAVFKPVNAKDAAAVDYDKDAYEWLRLT